MLHFTELAKSKVKEFIQGTGKPEMVLRIRVTGKNEKGFTFGFSLEEPVGERIGDQVFKEHGFPVCLDSNSLPAVKGATVDWVTQEDGAGFSVKNPHAPILSESALELKQTIIGAIRNIYDPEIPVNIYDLGLIYDILIDEETRVTIRMTLTAPNCPAAESLPAEVKEKVAGVPSVKECTIDLTWEPAWDKTMMSEEARLQLGL